MNVPSRSLGRSILVAIVLGAMAAALYLPAAGFDFNYYDEWHYVLQNPRIRQGLTVEGVRWAFTTPYASHYIPLTWISFMVDVSRHGTDPRGFHVANIALHAVNAALLFLLLASLTGATWVSALASALFAVHPLNVESVAWIYERKGLLSAFFSFWALLAYVRYVRRPGVARYLAVASFFFMALLSKPAVISLPAALLLLDWWPLGRLAGPQTETTTHAWRRLFVLVMEKGPLLLLSAGFGLILLVAFRQEEFLVTSLSLGGRAANSLISYLLYVWKAAWPRRLSVVYLIPEAGHPLWQAALASAVLIGVTLAALAMARRRPFLTIGWLWYLVVMFPAIGLLNVGIQAMANRYAYLPLIGLFLGTACGAAEIAEAHPAMRKPLSVGALLLIVVLGAETQRQLPFWRNGVTLFSRAVELDPDNYVAHNNLGWGLTNLGRHAEAAAHYREALRVQPQNFDYLHNLGSSLARLGRFDEAQYYLRGALQLRPDSEVTRENLRSVFICLGRLEEARSLRSGGMP